jgi:DNA-binding response OmpR family regulator
MNATRSHILVVDDDPAMRALMSEYLEENDLRVSMAGTGTDMHRQLEEHVIDLVLLDLRLGGEDGMQLARTLRDKSEIPVIIVTGKKDEADRVMGLEIAADDYITKPFSNRELLARIRSVLRRSESRRQADAVPRSNQRLPVRRLGVKPARAPADRARRRQGRAEQRRVQPASGLVRGAGARAHARPAARAVAAARRRSVRPIDRCADPASAPQD